MNHLPSESFSRVALLAPALNMESSTRMSVLSVFSIQRAQIEVGNKYRLVKGQKGAGIEAPSIRIAQAGREDIALDLDQVGVVGDNEIRADRSLHTLVRHRRYSVNDRGRRRCHAGAILLLVISRYR